MFSKLDSHQGKQDKTEKQDLDFQKTFYGVSTGRLMQNLCFFLPSETRKKLALTCRDAYRFEKVDRALTRNEFKIALMEDILRVLESEEYMQQLQVFRNPSGFLRLSNILKHLNPALMAELPQGCNVRLNFWPADIHSELGAAFALETRHSHPRGFCSFIVSGGYEHYLYTSSNNHSGTPASVVKISIGEGGKKTFTPQNKLKYLSAPIKEKLSENENRYAYFSNSLIHQVASRITTQIESPSSRDEGTLSINVVFTAKHQKNPKYSLYLTSYDKNNVVEKYDELSSEQSINTLQIVVKILGKKIEELKDLSMPSLEMNNVP